MVKSERIYSAQDYLEVATGMCYVVRGDNDVEEIDKILRHTGNNFWNYPLSEIDHIVENNLDVVLVDCLFLNEDKHEFDHILRWFEVPEDFKEE
jgi:hypothetical protein